MRCLPNANGRRRGRTDHASRVRPNMITIEDEIRQQLAVVYTEQGVEIWLHSRNTMLDRERPIELMRTTAGAEQVLAVACQLADGNF